jgi:hypothetical protein
VTRASGAPTPAELPDRADVLATVTGAWSAAGFRPPGVWSGERLVRL